MAEEIVKQFAVIKKKDRAFSELLSGNAFLYTRRGLTEVWMKMSRDFAQPINDNNMKIKFKASEPITEVFLREV
jgi:hypothetical protein